MIFSSLDRFREIKPHSPFILKLPYLSKSEMTNKLKIILTVNASLKVVIISTFMLKLLQLLESFPSNFRCQTTT